MAARSAPTCPRPTGRSVWSREAGDVDVLVTSAGLSQSGEITKLSPAEVDELLDVNLRAPVMLARLLAEPMAARRSGHIVFVSSLQGKSAGPYSALYTATKFGLRGFSLALRLDMADHGVGVSCVFPGFVRDAGMFADSVASLPARRPHRHARRRRRRDRAGDRTQPGRGRRGTARRCAPGRASPGSRPCWPRP